MARVSRKVVAAQAVQPVTIHIYRTAVYVRLSDADIRKKISDSIGTQKSMLVSFIESHTDLQLYEIYEDVNYTGTNFNRPAFIRMIEDIQAGFVDCVLVKDDNNALEKQTSFTENRVSKGINNVNRVYKNRVSTLFFALARGYQAGYQPLFLHL